MELQNSQNGLKSVRKRALRRKKCDFQLDVATLGTGEKTQKSQERRRRTLIECDLDGGCAWYDYSIKDDVRWNAREHLVGTVARRAKAHWGIARVLSLNRRHSLLRRRTKEFQLNGVSFEGLKNDLDSIA